MQPRRYWLKWQLDWRRVQGEVRSDRLGNEVLIIYCIEAKILDGTNHNSYLKIHNGGVAATISLDWRWWADSRLDKFSKTKERTSVVNSFCYSREWIWNVYWSECLLFRYPSLKIIEEWASEVPVLVWRVF